MVERLALSKFETAFSLSAARRSLGDFPAANSQIERERRVAQIVGDEFMANALYVEHESSGCRLTGWLCQPTYARAQPDLQHFYLNGRMLRDRLDQQRDPPRLSRCDVSWPASGVRAVHGNRSATGRRQRASREAGSALPRWPACAQLPVQDSRARACAKRMRVRPAPRRRRPMPIRSCRPTESVSMWPMRGPNQASLGLRVSESAPPAYFHQPSAVVPAVLCARASALHRRESSAEVTTRNAAAGLCVGAVAWHLYSFAGAGRTDPRRHACRTRTYDVRKNEDRARRTVASPVSRCSCRLSVSVSPAEAEVLGRACAGVESLGPRRRALGSGERADSRRAGIPARERFG